MNRHCILFSFCTSFELCSPEEFGEFVFQGAQKEQLLNKKLPLSNCLFSRDTWAKHQGCRKVLSWLFEAHCIGDIFGTRIEIQTFCWCWSFSLFSLSSHGWLMIVVWCVDFWYLALVHAHVRDWFRTSVSELYFQCVFVACQNLAPRSYGVTLPYLLQSYW